jgi:hypothetical protein
MRILKHEANAAFVLWHEHAQSCVDQHLPVNDDAALCRAHQSRDKRKGHGFASARASEQGRQPLRALKGDMELEITHAMMQIHLDHDASPCCVMARRCSHSEASSAAKAMAMETSVRRRVAPSFPALCI